MVTRLDDAVQCEACGGWNKPGCLPCCEAATPSVQVDEAMVKRAYEAFVEAGWCDEFGIPHPDLMPTLRAALTAALGQEVGK